MTDEDVLLRVQQITALGSIYGPYMDRGRRKPIFSWSLTEKDSYDFLLRVRPWLLERRAAKADVAIKHYETRDRSYWLPAGARERVLEDWKITGASQWTLARRHGLSRSRVQQFLVEARRG